MLIRNGAGLLLHLLLGLSGMRGQEPLRSSLEYAREQRRANDTLERTAALLPNCCQSVRTST